MPFDEEFRIVRSTIFVIANERDIEDLAKNIEKYQWIETIQIVYSEYPTIGSHDKIKISSLSKLSKITIDNGVHIHSLEIKDCMSLKHVDLSKDVEIHTTSLEYLPAFKEIRLEEKATINTLTLEENADGDVLLHISERAYIRTLTWGDRTYKDIQSREALRYLKPVHGYTPIRP